ncbi:protease modulator HflK [Novosphingobium sp.]|uniref:protease modulator HflK n=1 Tax=Novosphingobium sp. TaxID=1874826 RepID=UPI0031DC4849
MAAPPLLANHTPEGGDNTPSPEDGASTPPPAAGDGDPAPPRAGEPPRNPWAPEAPPPRRAPGIEEIFRQRRGGNGNKSGNGKDGKDGGKDGAPPPDLSHLLRLPPRHNGKSWWPSIIGGSLALGVMLSSVHALGLHEQGVVTTFGQYSKTLQPGFNWTLPWPFQQVEVRDVTTIKQLSVPNGEAENLMLTSDQSLVNISYVVRWSIRDLKLYSFQLKDPEGTVTEVAEAAMRASIAEVKLNDVMGGAASAEIGAHVQQRMQAVLDAYHAGVLIQGVDLKKADPPSKVNEAFQKVQAAQQDRSRYIQQARGYAQQTIARAEGEAAAFDRVYTQYKAAPEVTRRRMYYETMDRVLSQNDKVILPNGPTTYLPLPELRRRAEAVPDGNALPQPQPQIGGAQ